MKRPIFYILAALILIIFFGELHFQPLPRIGASYIEVDLDKEIYIEGVVKEVGKTGSGRTKVVLLTETIDNKKKSIKIQAFLGKEKILVSQRILIEGKLQQLSHARNPGGFDEYYYLKARKIQYKTFADLIEKGEIKNDLTNVLAKIKNKVSEVFDSCLPSSQAELIKSIIIGDKSGLTEDVKYLFRVAGIYHILAISGLHIVILASLINGILKIFLSRKKSGIITLIFLIFYALFTGASPSTVRAVIMCGVIYFADIFERQTDLLSSTAFACISILIYEPYYLWDISFQYSFGAVFGIGFLTVPIERVLNPIIKIEYLKKSLSVIFAVMVFTYPISSYHFYYFMPYSIFANLLIIPTVTLLILTGFLTGVAGVFFMPIAKFFAGTVFFMLNIYEAICTFIDKLPFSKILTGSTPILTIVLYYSFIMVFIIIMNTSGDIFLKNKKYIYLAGLLGFLLNSIYNFIPEDLEVTMLDVGQGDSFVITKDNYVFIIDGGDKQGEKVIPDYLDYKGIKKIDAIFVSHTDSDHILGVFEVLDRTIVKNIYLSSLYIENDDNYVNLISKADKNNINVQYLKNGDYIEVYNNFNFYAIYPFNEDEEKNINESSLVLKMSYGEIDALFTGDIGIDTENEILDNKVNLQSEVLKLAHHGSKYSNSENFLKAVSPKIAIVSSGENNSYGHPSPKVIEELENLNIPLYNTAENGAVILKTNGKVIKLEVMIKSEAN